MLTVIILNFSSTDLMGLLAVVCGVTEGEAMCVLKYKALFCLSSSPQKKSPTLCPEEILLPATLSLPQEQVECAAGLCEAPGRLPAKVSHGPAGKRFC